MKRSGSGGTGGPLVDRDKMDCTIVRAKEILCTGESTHLRTKKGSPGRTLQSVSVIRTRTANQSPSHGPLLPTDGGIVYGRDYGGRGGRAHRQCRGEALLRRLRPDPHQRAHGREMVQ